VDAYGHVSLRHPTKPDVYLLSGDRAPALVSSPTDFIEYYVANSSSVDPNAPKGYIERYIHGEMYKRYTDVNSVVHSHADSVLSFAASGVPMFPVFHMAGFLGKTAFTLSRISIVVGLHSFFYSYHSWWYHLCFQPFFF
jgi:ribulose-5-phosphate 4-epimerase/fuculose-1-phosphate aldolase